MATLNPWPKWVVRVVQQADPRVRHRLLAAIDIANRPERVAPREQDLEELDDSLVQALVDDQVQGSAR